MKKDFVFTFITQVIVLVSGLLVFKLAMTYLGEVGFSEFSIIKRNIAYIYTLVMLGLGVAVPRYIAKEMGAKSGRESDVLFAAVSLIVISLLMMGLVFFWFRQEIACLLFGDRTYTKFLVPIFVSLGGLSLHGMVYAYYRGKMRFHYSNIFQVLNIGVVPLFVFIFADNTQEVFLYTGIIVFCISLIAFVNIFISQTIQFDTMKAYGLKLLKYGIQRIPADFGLVSLFALPAVFSAHTEGIVIGGKVAFSISLLSLSGQAVAPIGLIMLPKISHLLGEKNIAKIHYYVKKLFLFSILVVTVGTATYQLFGEVILRFYLGQVDSDLVHISKHIMWGALFYPFYVIMRSVVDAYYTRAYNTASILAALAAYLISYGLTKNIYYALLIALGVLFLVTFYFIKPLLFGTKQ